MPCALGSLWKVKDGHLTTLELIAPFRHSGLSCSSVNNKSMTVCAMYSIFGKYIQKIFEKRAGMEPETDLFDLYKASIVGTEVLVTDVTACIHL